MKTAIHSVSYAGFCGQARLGLEEFIAHAGHLGYDGVSLAAKRPHASPLDMDAKRVAKVGKALSRARVECQSIAAYTDFAPSRAPGIPFDEMQVAYVESCGKLARAWGAKTVRVFTAYEHGTQDIRGAWAATVSALRACSEKLSPLGVTLAVQNHHDIGVATEALAELLAEVDRPNCKAGFDAWSPALQGLSGRELHDVAKRMAPLTIQTIVADYIRLPRFNYLPGLTNYQRVEPDLVMAVPLGEGFIDYPSFFRGLREGGYDGWVMYEMCEKLRGGGSMENLDRCARTFLSHLKKITA